MDVCIENPGSDTNWAQTLPREGGRRTLLDGAERPVRDMLLDRSFSGRSGLLMPVSRWISISDRANMMAPLFTLAWQAATYQAGIPTQSWGQETGGRRLCMAVEGLTHPAQDGVPVRVGVGRLHTSSQTTTVGPSHCAKACLVSRLPLATHAYK